MIPATIWNTLKSTLEENPKLKDYVKIVFEGVRYNVEPDSLPCIMLEPVLNAEVETDMNQIKRQFFHVDIYAFSDHNIHDFDKTIVGGANYKGILDIENDIRACLQSSYDLGGIVYDVRMDPTEFARLDEMKYPVRGLVIPVKILYSQDKGA